MNPIATGRRNETVSQRHIRLLRAIAYEMPDEIGEHQNDLNALDELIECGFISGITLPGLEGVQGIKIDRITIPGRLFLKELEEKEARKAATDGLLMRSLHCRLLKVILAPIVVLAAIYWGWRLSAWWFGWFV